MTVLIIDRKIWLQGEDDGLSFLLREADQKMCCIGIYLHECGVPKKLLQNKCSPGSLDRDIVLEAAPWLLNKTSPVRRGDTFVTSVIADELMTENDKEYLRGTKCTLEKFREQKEEKIKALFSMAGINVEFTGTY